MTLLRLAAALLASALATSCSTTTVTDRQTADPNERVARPDRILVYDVAATAEDLHADSALTGKHGERATPPTEEELAVGRRLGAAVAEELVAKIQEMGLPAVRGNDAPAARAGDLMLHGTFVALDEGSAVERVVIGFGRGAAELHTVIEGYLMTEQGLRLRAAGLDRAVGGRLSRRPE